nr:M28 family peptidase [uncultured Carboxylicivirga sp.]
MRILSSIVLAFILITGINAQNKHSSAESLITTGLLKKHLSVLASDSLAGRYTTSEGQKKAASYIKSEYIKAGLIPYNDTSYYQPFELWSWKWGKQELTIDGKQLNSTDDFLFLSTSPLDKINTTCVFVGYGQDTIIDNINLKDKVAFGFTDSFSSYYKLAYKLKSRGATAIILTNPVQDNAFEKLLKKKDSKHLNVTQTEPYFSKTATKVFIVKPNLAQKLFGKDISSLSEIATLKAAKKIHEVNITAHCPVVVEEVTTENVAGYIKGKTDETIVISAHYDHLGKKGEQIYYGADDNASGTTALLTLAEVFSKDEETPDRNILFLATSGEELGLLGALYFADHQKTLPFDVKANLNIDMIGRNDSIDKNNYIYLIGSNEYPVLDSLCNIANQSIGLTIDYGYAKKGGFGNLLNLSDHYAFHKQGIPVLGFFNGLHTDYHKPTDTIDKIEFEEMVKRIQLIYQTALLTIDPNSF